MFISIRVHTYVAKHRCSQIAKHTMNVAFDRMRWSFAALLEGKWPAVDWLGTPIDYSKRIGEAHGVHFVLGLQSYASLMSLRRATDTHTHKSHVSLMSLMNRMPRPHAGGHVAR